MKVAQILVATSRSHLNHVACPQLLRLQDLYGEAVHADVLDSGGRVEDEQHQEDGGHGLQGGEACHEAREAQHQDAGHHPPLLGLNLYQIFQMLFSADQGELEDRRNCFWK